MKRNELTILLSLVVLALVIGFWLLVISPKRSESASLKDDIDQLHSELSQAQQAATAGQEAQRAFPIDYRRLVVLGKAVPADGEQASLLVQLQNLATRSKVQFEAIDLSDTSGSAPASTSSSAPTTSTSGSTATPAASTSSSSSSSSTAATSTSTSSTPPAAAPADATEASAATLPIGASVGPAGLPVMPYTLKFTGDYFQIADFLKRLDGLVHTRGGLADVHGRLVTVDAFTLAPVQSETGKVTPVPKLSADLAVTTYVTPADQGLTAGATPTGPAPATPTLASGTPSSTSTTTSSTGPVPASAGPSTTSP